jgi:hypothetical protein
VRQNIHFHMAGFALATAVAIIRAFAYREVSLIIASSGRLRPDDSGHPQMILGLHFFDLNQIQRFHTQAIVQGCEGDGNE